MWICSKEVGLAVAVAVGYDIDVPGRQSRPSILVRVASGYGKGTVKASLDTCMVEVERYCVILES